MLARYHQNVLNTFSQFCWKLVMWHIYRKPWVSRWRIWRPDLGHRNVSKTFYKFDSKLVMLHVHRKPWVSRWRVQWRDLDHQNVSNRLRAPALYPSGRRAATPALYPSATLDITRYIQIRSLFSGCARGPCYYPYFVSFCAVYFIVLIPHLASLRFTKRT